MNELNLDAESITRNKTYDALDHLHHLLKVGWPSDSNLIKKFLTSNSLTTNDLNTVLSKINESTDKNCCTERDN